ncbi:MAG: hypothetical protein HEQ25_08730 [Dolichospermum sp. DET73]|nr:hypothetical protein [Dolichospermum sp. DET73]
MSNDSTDFNDFNKFKEVYIGLPEHLKHLVFWVEKKYRTNSLSLTPGPYDVITVNHDLTVAKPVLAYNNIHTPSMYIPIFYDGVVYHGTVYNGTVYARKHKQNNTTSEFVEVWNSSTSTKKLKAALEEFESKDPNE